VQQSYFQTEIKNDRYQIMCNPDVLTLPYEKRLFTLIDLVVLWEVHIHILLVNLFSHKSARDNTAFLRKQEQT
jgi:hypothetical protein